MEVGIVHQGRTLFHSGSVGACAIVGRRMSKKRKHDRGVVFSTQYGELCAECNRPLAGCVCARTADAAPATDGIVRVARLTQGRKGKGVTAVTGVPLGASELKALAKRLKQVCGSGGTLKDGVIEIQGDHRDRIVEELSGRGWTVKRAGG